MPDSTGRMTVEEAIALVGSSQGATCKILWDGLNSVSHDDYLGAEEARSKLTADQQLACRILRYGYSWAHGLKLRMHGRKDELIEYYGRDITRLEYEDDLFGAGPLPPPGGGFKPPIPPEPKPPDPKPPEPKPPEPKPPEPITEQQCEQFIIPLRDQLNQITAQLTETQQQLKTTEAFLANGIKNFENLSKERDSLVSQLSEAKRLRIPDEITQSLEVLGDANVVNDTLRARALRVKAFVELTYLLQPVPSEHVGTLSWIASVSQYGPGRRSAIKRLKSWLESKQ